ncbi:YihY/virulence factor BrkB family protein [Actinacidiphila bryophytorum]|uniref:Membrane protein n=1 Tax=Actinacidiphila bryophytorum TaxID=1436133 RepID=A0A9W4E1L3_9ACTN|nr:YihY/virulence factor BrkB family protein [Actinacidiphila bryophytorum]MBM9436496.1 YihY/virulence factor BrkB family protein [Actinacidiphila bryophytorum]MBN6547890.1 YihY/virulence factor BrkB family protein [Actinacidiphila bryophytorum]CAG7600947.1 Membrane protein [Actinacidiphila bryophytorum]
MDWLTRVPWIGPRLGPWYDRRVAPLVERGEQTHAWRAFAHMQDVHWTRLAAAMTFTSFLALFPLITVAAAIGAALLSQSQLDRLENKLTEQIPGIADQIDISGLVDNAGTVGLIASAVLLVTGIGWVSSLRDCLRAVWGKDKSDKNVVVTKLEDAGILFGLGIAVLVSLGASGFATTAVNWTADRIGLSEHSSGRVLLTVVGYLLAVAADFLILLYLLTLMPGVDPPRQPVILAALIGAVGLEILKVALASYLQRVAGRNIYGAFGTPVALLLWFNFMAKLLLYCAAWTATPRFAHFAPVPPPPEPAEDHGEGGATRWKP